MKKIGKVSQNWKLAMTGTVLLLAVFLAPFFSRAEESKKIYVDCNSSFTQDGSVAHPYQTISQALSQAKENTEVHIADGVYRENIVIPKGVQVYGDNRDKVIIKADDDDNPTVSMKDQTRLDGVTVEKGEHGIYIQENKKVSIVDCRVVNNRKDGIYIEESQTNKRYLVSISKTIIENNGRAGIYSEKRKLSVTESLIQNNEGDGAIFQEGSKVWLYKNIFKKNEKSGLKLVLDNSQIWSKKNTYRQNKREGIEINAYGKPGIIDIGNSRIHNNGRWGIARIQRENFSETIWKGFNVQTDTRYWENGSGDFSEIIKIF